MSFSHWKKLLYTHLDVDRHTIRTTITDHARLSPTYLFLLLAATVLATLGLLIGSSPVIIGAMIVSPLTWPILRVAYGIATADYSMLFRGIRLLVVSVGLIFFVAFLITKFLPLSTLTDQIVSRTNPTIIDLLVALIAGALAGLALVNKRISKTGAGVAIAASLLPPMCVGGIGAALGLPDITIGGILLSLANIIAILFIASLILVFLIKEDDPLRAKGIGIVTVLLIIIAIPLVFFFFQYVERSARLNEKEQIQTILKQTFPHSFVQTVDISPDTIHAVILIEKGTYISPALTQNIQAAITEEVNKTYKLHLHFVPELQSISE